MLPPRPPSPPSGPPLGTYLKRANDDAPEPPVPATTRTTARSMKLTAPPRPRAVPPRPSPGARAGAAPDRGPRSAPHPPRRRDARRAGASGAAARRPAPRPAPPRSTPAARGRARAGPPIAPALPVPAFDRRSAARGDGRGECDQRGGRRVEPIQAHRRATPRGNPTPASAIEEMQCTGRAELAGHGAAGIPDRVARV